MNKMNMIKNMKKGVIRHFVAAFAVVLLGCGTATAQEPYNQNTACPGWHNPTNFTMGNGVTENGNPKGWRGMMGIKNAVIPNAYNNVTGITWNGNLIQPGALSTTVTSPGSYCGVFPPGPNNQDLKAHAFTILDQNTSYEGHNADPNTGYALPFVPTHFNIPDSLSSVQTEITHSIRVGDACGRQSGTPNAEALYYYMTVKPQNALLYLYYACVVESPNATSGHGTSQDPAFMIRVCKKNSLGDWVSASPTGYYPSASGIYPDGHVCDTLAYFIPSTPYGTGSGQSSTGVQNNVDGWHYYACNLGTGYGSPLHNVWYKDWSKVILDLSSLLNDDVRIEVMVSDCSMTDHFAYAYVAGECRPMKIESSGCPAGMETDVTTLTAPRGMDNYVWYRSEYGTTEGNQTDGFSLPNSNPSSTAYYTFARLTPLVGTEADTAFIYKVQAEDFQVDYCRNAQHAQGIPAAEDSMGNFQVFRCEVTSKINPAKPFKSYMYTVVQNTKPTMEIKKLEVCGGDVQLRNQSYVTGSYTMANLDSTIWSFYNNPACGGDPLRVDTGENLTVNFPGSDLRYVRVRTNIDENDPSITTPLAHNECYSEAIYEIQPMPNPVAGFTILPDTVRCADDIVTLNDTTTGSTYRVWRFRDTAATATMDLVDEVVGRGETNRQYQRVFTHDPDPIELTVRNGLYYLNPVNQQDTIWCEYTVTRRVHVFQHPELTVTGGTVVCLGDRTDATVHTEVDSCTYKWYSSYSDAINDRSSLAMDSTLRVAPYADTATYYVRVTTPPPANCWAVDSIQVYLVRPKLTMLPPDGNICPGDVATLVGSNAHHYTWTATPADSSLNGQDSAQTIMVRPQVTTTYTLTGHGNNDCNATPLTSTVTVHPYPVPTIELDPEIVDSEYPTVLMRDVSPNSVTTMWLFNGGEEVMGREVTHTFEEATGADSVYVTLINANDIGCDTNKVFSIPVKLYTAWFPNIFTPGSEDANASFRFFSINSDEMDVFYIWIYNRFGQLVFESSDPHFVWDGTMADGTICPQGAYTYICRFRKPGANSLSEMHGSVTVVR